MVPCFMQGDFGQGVAQGAHTRIPDVLTASLRPPGRLVLEYPHFISKWWIRTSNNPVWVRSNCTPHFTFILDTRRPLPPPQSDVTKKVNLLFTRFGSTAPMAPTELCSDTTPRRLICTGPETIAPPAARKTHVRTCAQPHTRACAQVWARCTRSCRRAHGGAMATWTRTATRCPPLAARPVLRPEYP